MKTEAVGESQGGRNGNKDPKPRSGGRSYRHGNDRRSADKQVRPGRGWEKGRSTHSDTGHQKDRPETKRKGQGGKEKEKEKQ